MPRETSPAPMLKAMALLAAALACPMLLPVSAADDPTATETPEQQAERLKWWRDARFGMFIHWGPVALRGTEIGWSRGAEVPVEEYDRLYLQFNPTNFDPDAWARTAKQAGMKYVVFTTKHHDGFCMWDTRQTDFNVMRSPFGRDVVKELAEACKRQGLIFGTYHSVCDWHHPDFPLTSPGGKVKRETSDLDRYETYLKAQVAELIQNYGPLGIMWFDVPQEFTGARGERLLAHTRSLQPSIIVNNRSGAAGDYDTPEQRVGKYQDTRPWETCMTICRQWSWKPDDEMKSLEECLRSLILCAAGDGNLLFNVGPTPDGRIESRQAERLSRMGDWLSQYGETIYGTRGGPWKPTRDLASTRKGNTIYLHVLGSADATIQLPPIPARVIRAAVLGGPEVQIDQSEAGLEFDLPTATRQPIDTIVRLDLDSPALDIPAIDLRYANAKVTASSVFEGNTDWYGPEMAFDGDEHSRWATDVQTREASITADLGTPRTIRRIRVVEAYPGRVQRFEIQYRDDDGWKTLTTGNSLGAAFSHQCDPVTTREIRLNILESTGGPTIAEIEFLDK